ncbi:hypothetical protein MNBD_GAMMA16-1518 [hydrothermal vent metagenome]|uniref:Uncharacterized protein n=1 Tax=hydrothermal vent metagenome TaxID=652676 RepID=A0A3B0ZCG0_9ZZZZ
MGAYLPLFSFAVEHGFYEDGVAHELSFTATGDTVRVMKNTGLLVKPTTGGFTVLFDSKDYESLLLYVNDKKEPLNLIFKAYSNNANFISRTDSSIETSKEILFFNNNNNQHISDGKIKLHDHKYVSMLDLEELDSKKLADVLDEKEKQIPPLFVLSFRITKKSLDSVDALKNYCIKFRERQLFWKYYFLGQFSGKKLLLADLDKTTEFVFSGKEKLEGHREAITFRTAQRLSLQERSQYRFQLIEKENGKEKVIIKRLPVAKDAHLGQAIIDGKSESVSEIYING